MHELVKAVDGKEQQRRESRKVEVEKGEKGKQRGEKTELGERENVFDSRINEPRR